ncbi:hypothetical protein J5X84_27560 [Streptosporangiaceae bacterium NEAU-GS5]|nr:hypothetical protein [Streptosporangiaceae bacterium NEAU-GS5]
MSENAVILGDEQAAERARRSLLAWDGPRGTDGRPLVRPCSWDDSVQRKYPPDVSIPREVEVLSRGLWSGELETFAVRRGDLPRQPTYRDSVAHVAVAVRHGRTVVYLRWQGPAGEDLRGALRRGRTAVLRTLDLLPAA